MSKLHASNVSSSFHLNRHFSSVQVFFQNQCKHLISGRMCSKYVWTGFLTLATPSVVPYFYSLMLLDRSGFDLNETLVF